MMPRAYDREWASTEYVPGPLKKASTYTARNRSPESIEAWGRSLYASKAMDSDKAHRDAAAAHRTAAEHVDTREQRAAHLRQADKHERKIEADREFAEAGKRALEAYESAKHPDVVAAQVQAKSASERANVTGKAIDHAKAAEAHEHVLKTIQRVGGGDISGRHSGARSYATVKRESHADSAGAEWDESKHPRDGQGRFT